MVRLVKCSICGKEKSLGEYYYRKNGNRRKDCIDCHQAKISEWNKKHKEERRKYSRDWARNNRLMLNGKHITVKKRTFYGICELCGKRIERFPHWHHWDDDCPEKGIWLHPHCHTTVEVAEKNDIIRIPLYEKIKELVELSEPVFVDFPPKKFSFKKKRRRKRNG